VKVAAYQAPLLPEGSFEAVRLIQERVRECETKGVSVLCCPEAILGGLADYSDNLARIAIRTDGRQLESVLAPLASDRVTVIAGFTEHGLDGALYNAAAVFQRGQVTGLYRKIHPALRRFRVSGWCRDPCISGERTDLWHRHLQRLELPIGATNGRCRCNSILHPYQQWPA
jgi:predicted amidohydrolase